jgi:hypothetical protein
MGTTGAPWNIPFADPSDLVRSWPALSEDIAEAVADGLDAAPRLKQVQQVVTTTDFTTSSGGLVDLTGVSVTIVPGDATNRIVMMFTANCSNGAAGNQSVFRFRRDTTDLYEECFFISNSSGGRVAAAMMLDEVAGDTSSRVYSVRARQNGGNTTTVHNSTLIVMEYSV